MSEVITAPVHDDSIRCDVVIPSGVVVFFSLAAILAEFVRYSNYGGPTSPELTMDFDRHLHRLQYRKELL